MATLLDITEAIRLEEQILLQGGGKSGADRQRTLGRLPVRERLAILLDRDRPFLELGLWAAHRMYPDWGSVRAASLRASDGSAVSPA